MICYKKKLFYKKIISEMFPIFLLKYCDLLLTKIYTELSTVMKHRNTL